MILVSFYYDLLTHVYIYLVFVWMKLRRTTLTIVDLLTYLCTSVIPLNIAQFLETKGILIIPSS